MTTSSTINYSSTPGLGFNEHSKEDRSSDKVDAVAAAALEKGGPLAQLPDELLVLVARKLDLNQLLNLNSTSCFWNHFGQDHALWRKFAAEIGCPLRDNLPYRDQVELFVRDIIRKVKIWATPDLETIKTSDLTISQIKHLQNFLIARDIVEVWECLGMALDPYAELTDIHGFDVQTCDSMQLVEHAKNFNNWFVAHQAALANVTELSFMNRYLTHLPAQIALLPNLTQLDLTGNLLSSFPSLPQVTEITLSKNPLKLDPNQEVDYSSLLLTDGLPQEVLKQIGCSIEEIDQLKDLRGIENIPDHIQQIAARQYLTLEQFITLFTWRQERNIPERPPKIGRSLKLTLGLVGIGSVAYGIYHLATSILF
ncbi:MAG: F-box-like domain-containing protein [Verrucomicrobia bacterium]|nr:F-box-like domain-containing protein [Verrucomicrobiota bacterium]